MKRLLILLLLFSSVASAQNIPGYTYFNSRQDIFTLRARAGMHLPGGSGSPVLASGQWVGSGAIWVDTVGMKVYVKYGTSWAEVGGGSELTPLGSGYPLLHEGVGVKSFLASNGLTADSATSGQVGVKLGGALLSNTTIAAGNRQLALSWDSLATSTGGLRMTSTSSQNGTKMMQVMNFTQSTTATTNPAYLIYGDLNRLGTGSISFNAGFRAGVSGGIVNRGILLSAGHGIGATANEASYGVDATVYTSGTITGRYGEGPLVGGSFVAQGGSRGSSSGWYGTSTTGIKAQASLSHTSASTDSTFTATAGDFVTVTNGSGTAIGAKITTTYNSGIGGTPKLYGLIVTGATTEKPLSGFLATSNTPNSIVHIGPAASGYASLMIEETATAPSSPVDGMMWHYADSLYFRSGSTTYNLTHLTESGSGGVTQDLQDVLDEGGWLTSGHVINQDGYSLQWNGPNFFKDTTTTQITHADFNSGIDYLVKSTSTEDTTINFQLNVADFFKATASTNGSQSAIWMQPTSGNAHYFLGHTDSLGTLIRSGVRGDDHYGLLYSVFDTDSAYVRTRGHEGLKLYGGSNGIYELANVPTYDGSGGSALVIDSDNRIYKTSITGDGTTVVINSDVSSSASTSAQDITGMSWTATSGTLYEFEAVIFYTTSDATIGAQFGINGPASPTYVTFQNLTPQTATSIAQGAGSDYSVRGVSSATILQQGCAVVRGFIQTSSTGTVTIRFAPETATASGVVIKAGSRVKYWARH